MSGDYLGPDIEVELAKLKKRAAEPERPGNVSDKILEEPPAQSPTPTEPRGEAEAQQRLAALQKEEQEGVPADLPEGQPEMTEKQVQQRLAELAKEVKSGKKTKKVRRKLPKKPPSEPGDDVLRDMALRGRQESEATKEALRELKTTNKGTRTLLDRFLGRNK